MIVLYILILLIIFLYSILIEPYHLIIKTVSVNVDGIRKNFDKIKIIHITDLHIKKIGYLEKKLINKINQLMPDILFVTGDFIKNNNGIEPCSEFFKNIKPK